VQVVNGSPETIFFVSAFSKTGNVFKINFNFTRCPKTIQNNIAAVNFSMNVQDVH
jgi:hypothetical protein